MDYMKRPLLILSLLCLLTQFSEAQLWKMKRYEAAAGIGPTFFFGDVGGYSNGKNIIGLKDMTFLQTRVNVGLNVKYRISQAVSARVNFAAGLLKATDERGSNLDRGYETSTTFFEPTIIGEYYFIKNRAENSYVFLKRGRRVFSTFFSSLDFYVFSGIGGMIYSVNGNDKVVNNPNGFDSGGFAAVIPIGVGTSMIFSPNINFGVELGGRYALSDGLDGYTSQFSSKNDVYYSLNFTVTYKMKTGKNGLPSFR
jgi:hypothetical protein